MAPKLRAVVTVAGGWPKQLVAETFMRVAKAALGPELSRIEVKVNHHGKKVRYPDPQMKFPTYPDWPIQLIDFWSMFCDELCVLAQEFTPEQSSFHKFVHGTLWTGYDSIGIRVTSINGVRYAVVVDQDALVKKAEGDTEALPYQLCRDEGHLNEWPDIAGPQATLEACRELAIEDAIQSVK